MRNGHYAWSNQFGSRLGYILDPVHALYDSLSRVRQNVFSSSLLPPRAHISVRLLSWNGVVSGVAVRQETRRYVRLYVCGW